MPGDNRSTGRNCPNIPRSEQDQKLLRTKVENGLNLSPLYEQAAPLETNIVSTASALYGFFHLNGYMIDRNDWKNRKIAQGLLRYHGWVYAFYGEEELPIYVGETGRTFKSRFGEHEKKLPDWWAHWIAVKVLPCPNQSVRKIFESLLGLIGGYRANRSQPVVGDNILDDVIISLLLLGNDNDALPIFPDLTIDP